MQVVLKQVTAIGRNWAAYGLNKGRTALESGADRLRATAEVLGSMSTKLAAPVEHAQPHAENEPQAATPSQPSNETSH